MRHFQAWTILSFPRLFNPAAAAPEKFWSDPEADDLLSAQV